MKTKPKPALRARKMFANYYKDNFLPALHPSRKSSIQHCAPSVEHKSVPVAVIPLRNVPAIIYEAMVAFQSEPSGGFEPGMRAALTAIGVLPRQRKGGAK